MLTERSDLNARCDVSSGAMELEGVGSYANRSKGKNFPADRFIPSFVKKSVYDTFENEENVISDSKKNQFGSILKNHMFFDQRKQNEFEPFEKNGNGDQVSRKLFYFASTEQKNQNLEILETDITEKTQFRTVCNYSRNIKKAPERILDAPALQDDFYFDIVDWSPTNFISIGLINHVYYLNATTNKSSKMATYHEPNALVSCLKSNPLGDILAVGTTNGDIDLFDFDKEKNLRKIHGHTGRVGALSWKDNLIASGSRDGHILVTDIRSKKDYQIKLQSHRQEICGLSFNCFDSLLASGGNDNKVVVWDITKGEEYLRMTEHTAAVKALAWSPHQSGLLASGGGSTDKTIKLWNVKLNRIEKSVDTGSQVCALRFSKSVNEMVSTHGFSQNQIEIWKTPEMGRVATLMGHTSRVLYLSMNPTGEEIVTASADETLRFWKVFPGMDSNGAKFGCGSKGFTKFMQLRQAHQKSSSWV